jgi:hypothetical protein
MKFNGLEIGAEIGSKIGLEMNADRHHNWRIGRGKSGVNCGWLEKLGPGIWARSANS